MKTGLFLTPGAARTAYYVGALDVLIRESGIHFDVIAGSSVGALNGAFAAMDETRQLIEIWKNWTTEDVMAALALFCVELNPPWADSILFQR